jgi:hypothetical protein
MEFKYDVSLSFAGEDREYVDHVARLLKEQGVKVYYDKFELTDSWGKDLAIHFDVIYRRSARFAIPFISKHYKEKIWPNHELRSIFARAIENNEEYILPVRFDDTEMNGLRPTIGYIDLRNTTPEELANMVLRKLGSKESTPISEQFQEKRSDVLNVQIYNTFLIGNDDYQSNGPLLKVRITNTLSGEYRYFYEPTFRVTIPKDDGSNGFHLLDLKGGDKYPVKLEYGQELEIPYPLALSQLEVWKSFESGCEFYAICSTTVGEKFESNKEMIQSIIKAFDFSPL